MYYKILIVLAGLAAAFFAYTQFVGLVEDNAKLAQQVQLQQQAIVEQQKFMAKQAANIQNLSQSLTESQQTVDQFMVIFDRHNLEALSYARPGLIERRINDATLEVLKEIERETNN